jgi:hypothetical protein
MIKKIFSFSLILLLLTGCDKVPETWDFPIIKTLNPVDVTSDGATFRCELIQEGKINTASYGFIWGIKEDAATKFHKINLGSEIPADGFKARVDSSLSEGFEYYIRAFATFGDKTVYGNTVSLISKGCKLSGWCRELSDIKLEGESTIPYGWSDGTNGYVIFQNKAVYRYDTDSKSFERIANFPLSGNSGTRFSAVGIGNIQYVFSDMDKNLYKMDDGKWSVESSMPFYYGSFGGYYHGYSYSNQVYLLSSYLSYAYKPDNKYWQSRSIMPASYYSVGGTELNGYAYLMDCTKKIIKYNPQDNTWEYISTFPGTFPASAYYFSRYDGKIIGFSQNNTIYFGFCFDEDASMNWIEKSMWEYNLTSNTWRKIEDFPQDLSHGRVFYFTLKGKLYIGHEDSNIYSLYSLDLSKL